MVLILILSVAAVFSSCYITKSGKMKQIEGTYELTVYSGKSNYLAEREIKLLMVIRSDGTGYYAYQREGVDPHVAELRCRFLQDPDESGKYDYVEINFDGSSEYVKFGVYATLKSTTLNFQKPVFTGNIFKGDYRIDYYIDADFNRVDKATDLSYINNNFGMHNPLPFGALRFDGTHELRQVSPAPEFMGEVENPYVYSFLELDIVGNTARVRSMLKGEDKHVDVTHPLSVVKDESGSFYFSIGDAMTLYPNTMYAPSTLYLVEKTAEIHYTYTHLGYPYEEDIQHWINTYADDYFAQKTLNLIEEGILGLMSFECNMGHGDNCTCENKEPNVADPDKYTPKAFAEIDVLIADYLGRYKMSESSIRSDLLKIYKKARLHYLYEAALENLGTVYDSSTSSSKDFAYENALKLINKDYNTSYSFVPSVVCMGHAEGVECNCTGYSLEEDAPSAALAKYTVEHCQGYFTLP